MPNFCAQDVSFENIQGSLLPMLTYLVELLDQRIVDLAAQRRQDTLLGQCALQDLLDSYRARDANYFV